MRDEEVIYKVSYELGPSSDVKMQHRQEKNTLGPSGTVSNWIVCTESITVLQELRFVHSTFPRRKGILSAVSDQKWNT
jgi:hypothetical protein